MAERSQRQPNARWQKGTPVLLAGLVIGIRMLDTPNGRIAIATLDDRGGRVDAVIDVNLLESSRITLEMEDVLVVDGELSVDDFNGGFRIRAQAIFDIAAARERFARSLLIRLNKNSCRDSALERMLETLAEHGAGSTPVTIDYDNGEASARIRAGNRWLVKPGHQLLERLEEIAGESAIELIY